MIDDIKPQFRPVKFKASKHKMMLENATTLASERGNTSMSLPAYILEAVTFFEANRPKSEEA